MSKKRKYVTSPSIFLTPAFDYDLIELINKSAFTVKDEIIYEVLLFFLTPKSLDDAIQKGFNKDFLEFLIKEGFLTDNNTNIWNKYNWNRSFFLLFSQMDLEYIEFNNENINKSQNQLIHERRQHIGVYKKNKNYPKLYKPKNLYRKEIKLKEYKEDFFDLDLIKHRESVRSFSNKKVSFEILNKVLYASTENIRIAQKNKNSDDFFLLNSFYSWAVIYVYVQGVKNISKGLYFYDPKNNTLHLVNDKVDDEKMSKVINGQYWFGGGGFCIFIGSHWERYMWLYRHSRAYINLLIQIGELSQEFSSTATSLGLEGWLTPAVSESEAASIFKIKEKDGVDILLFMKFGLSKSKNPDIEIIRKFKSISDRKQFEKELHLGFASSDFDLDKNNIYIIKVRNKKCTALKSSSGTFYLNMVPNDISLLGLDFFNINESQLNKIKRNYYVKEKLHRIEFFYKRNEFQNRLKKSKNLKRFMKKYDCRVKTKYARQEVLALFERWRKSFEKRGKRVPSREFFLQLLDYKNRSKYGIEILYFEIEGKLVGLKAVYPHHKNSNLLVMRYKCMDHSYDGLDKFMDFTLTKRFSNFKYFTDGGDFVGGEFKTRFDFKLKQRKPDKMEKIYQVKVLSKKWSK